MKRTAKAVVITAAALVILGGILAALLLTKPKPKPANVNLNSIGTEDPSAYITDRRADEVFSITVNNADGTFTFTRQTRAINSVNESGEPVKINEFFWTSEELCGVPQSDYAVRNFIGALAGLPEKNAVEDNAEDFSKYGLSEPRATALLRFDDGTSVEMLFGITNPVDEASVYFALGNSRDVKLVNYYAVSDVFSDIRRFAKLLLVDSTTPTETLTITRPELDAPLELKMTPESGEGSSDEFRFTAPVSAEINAAKGRELFYGVCGLTMETCEFLEQTEELLEQCGLSEARAVVKFTDNGKERELLIGNEIRQKIAAEDDTSRPPVETVTGYYATVSGVPGIYALARENAPWLSATFGGLVSHKPLSPYIFSVGNVEVRLKDDAFTFQNENETFTYNGNALEYERFRELFNMLTAELDGDELSGEVGEELLAEITFNYKTDEYGTPRDTLSFYELDERRCAVVLNGTPLFAASRLHVGQIAEKISALTGGANSNSQNL